MWLSNERARQLVENPLADNLPTETTIQVDIGTNEAAGNHWGKMSHEKDDAPGNASPQDICNKLILIRVSAANTKVVKDSGKLAVGDAGVGPTVGTKVEC